jgi:hypothetical protein
VSSPSIGTSSINWAQQSRFSLKTEIESSLQNVFRKINRTVFSDDRMMDNVKKHIISTNVSLSQTFRSYLQNSFIIKHDGKS